MKSHNIIEVRDLSVCYRTYRSKRKTLRESAIRTLLKRDERVEVHALRNVSFEVAKGQ